MERRQFLKTSMSSLLGINFLANVSRGDAKTKRPNILFCIADDASYPHMSAYGCPWVDSPGFDRVAKDGILFTHAYTPNAKCSPSRACILTGRNSWQLEEAANHICNFPQKFKTYPETLSENGYFVGFTGKGWAPGNPGEINGKKRQLTGKAYQKKTTRPPAKAISNRDYTENFRDFMDDKPDDQPFCFWYGGHEPHRGYEYGAGIRKGNKDISDLDRVLSHWPDNDTVRTDMLDYAFEIEYFDKHLRQILDLLEEKGELDNTIVVVTADNGMPFPRVKGQEYEQSNHMPLAVMWNDGIKNTGLVVEDYVSFIDLAPTFLDAAGVDGEDCGMQPITGQSWRGIFNTFKSGQVDPKKDHVLIGKERHDIGRPDNVGYPVRGIVKNGYLYLHNFKPDRWPAGNPETGYTNTDGSPTKTEVLQTRKDSRPVKYWQGSFGKRPQEELYDVRIDADCTNNLAGIASYEKLKKQLKEQLFKELKEQGDPRMFGRGDIFDEYLYADNKWNNLYEKLMRKEIETPGWINPSDIEERLD